MRVVGRSGVVMDLPEQLARALLADGSVRRAGARRPPAEQDPPSPPVDESGWSCNDCEVVARSPAGLAAHRRARHLDRAPDWVGDTS